MPSLHRALNMSLSTTDDLCGVGWFYRVHPRSRVSPLSYSGFGWSCVLFLETESAYFILFSNKKKQKDKKRWRRIMSSDAIRSILHEDGMEVCLILRHQPITPLFFHGNHLARENAAGEVDCSSVGVSFQVRRFCSFILSQPFKKITCLYHT